MQSPGATLRVAALRVPVGNVDEQVPVVVSCCLTTESEPVTTVVVSVLVWVPHHRRLTWANANLTSNIGHTCVLQINQATDHLDHFGKGGVFDAEITTRTGGHSHRIVLRTDWRGTGH